MTDRPPDELSPELLTAYADGQLAPRDRALVEQWLSDHPEARDLLDTQESLSPRNFEFWQAVNPPAPSHRQWDHTRDGIRRAIRTSTSRRWLPWMATLAGVATASAATVLMLFGPGVRGKHTSEPELPSIVTVAAGPEDEPFPMANAEDVRIVSLPEAAAHLLVVGEHPLRDALVVLAKADEIEFFGIGTDPTGRFPDNPTEVAPDDPPMIWAPKEP